MRKVRIIARLDIKGQNLIKGVHMEGLRVIGSPAEYAHKYYQQGADELIYIDTVASLYGRNNLSDLLERSVENIFIPLTVGGGIRSVEDATRLLRSGADKVAINTAAVANPGLITEISRRFGSQCMVLSVQAKSIGPKKWEVFTENGRERTGLDVLEWIQKGIQLGAGEILLTSVDREGTRKGFDVDLVRAVAEQTTVPVIASGGMGNVAHLVQVAKEGLADAVAMADVLHYERLTIGNIKEEASSNGIQLRKYAKS
ncbi:imidazole glycerol phosphate synthase subunit HisF [Leptospira brenneri]|uniref:imidazole glycerol-phosphate synthase n=1 Tax=Leptospira brenneri TaxID=2023182 RepID=A0A2M9Y1S5_9LEPT|nr:imidazole glycerol phosphate synthase cyclase subunit [Leptospira brenneri]PJZ45522.1 imidazole glycerol phosphate synthase subunit HisF [Leptospira brenneri]TGK92015.1 imidazole glycerol phosphate synthase subunit HisF [Leptospira brenneri]